MPKATSPKHSEQQKEYQNYLLFLIAFIALPVAYLLFRAIPVSHRYEEYTDVCTSLPRNLTILNRFHNDQDQLIPYNCWGTAGEFRYGLPPDERSNYMTKKPNKSHLKYASDTSFFDHYMQVLVSNDLTRYLVQPEFKMPMLELIKIFNVVSSIAENKNVGLRCGESRALTIARIFAHNLKKLGDIPDFLSINFSFDTDKPVNPDDLNVMTDHGTLLLLHADTLAHLNIQQLFNSKNNFELSNSRSNVSDKISLVIRRLLNPSKKELAFQCDAWLPAAGVITQKDFGHCTNELFIKYPDKVESIQLLSVKNNPFFPSLVKAFFTRYPDIKNWLLEPGQPQKEMHRKTMAGFK